MLKPSFFDRDAITVAIELLGKVLCVKYRNCWLSAMIIETESYFIHEKGSHSFLGYTEKRKALFMKAGTIYMYYARGSDSLNVSCNGDGNAVLIKSGIVYTDPRTSKNAIKIMQKLNPMNNNSIPRPPERLCSGQTLLCKSLGLKVKEWNQRRFDVNKFYIEDVGYEPKKIIQSTRLGIAKGRDEHLTYRFIDYDNAKYCTKNPITIRNSQKGKDYIIFDYARV